MLADIELAGVIADDHGAGEQAMRLEAAHKAPSVAISADRD